MTYAKIFNNEILELGPRPKWIIDGEPVSDEVLASGGFQTGEDGDPLKDINGDYILATDQPGWVPVVYQAPEFNPRTHRVQIEEIDQWDIFSDRVEATYSVIPLTVEAVKEQALDRVNREYSNQIEAIGIGYPEAEQKSWYVQIEEAAIVLGDDDKPTPWIDNAAPARGITREALATLIQAQNIAYRQFHGTLTGIRQSLRDQIESLPMEEASIPLLEAIEWPSS